MTILTLYLIDLLRCYLAQIETEYVRILKTIRLNNAQNNVDTNNH